MNYRAIFYYLSMVLKLTALFMLPSAAIALFDRDFHVVRAFMMAVVLMLITGILLDCINRCSQRRNHGIYAKDSFIVVAVCWIFVTLFGALPYYLSGEIPSYVDSLFESVSGFTTTGSSILADVEVIPKGLLFWRNFSIWIGGMGVLLFLLAASGNNHSVNLMKAETPGPAPGKLVPRLRQSSKILYGIYISLTLLQTIALLCGGMPLFDSINCALSTAGTGGLSIKNASIGAYNSAYIDGVVTFFMLLCGINFNMFYFLLIRNWRAIWRSEELRVYLGIFSISTILIALNLWHANFYPTLTDIVRYVSFNVASLMTTTGFTTANYDHWPEFSRMLLITIMLIGGCAGSTAGGIKVSRLLILLKESKRLIFRMAHPRAVGIVKLDGKQIERRTVHYVSSFFLIYTILTVFSILVVSLDNFDFETTVTSVLACVGNIGPGLGMVSPAGNFSAFSDTSKVMLSMNMLFGRLEIYPLLLLFSPRTWTQV